MKTSPENIILNKNKLKFLSGVFLVAGNEESLIFSIKNILIKHLKKNGFNDIQNLENTNVDFGSEIHFGESLFFESKTIIYQNPKEVNFEFLEKNLNDRISIIIVHNKLTGSSKIKRGFDNHKKFNSINCYELSLNFKKKIIDKFINDEAINLEKNSYWHLVENLPSLYGCLESELIKLKDFNPTDTNHSELKFLISGNNWNGDIDALFFSSILNKKNIIKKTREIIKAPGDAYILLQKIKFYIDLVSRYKNTKEVEDSFPRYLFMHKSSFLDLYNKMNNTKVLNILNLIKKNRTSN